MMRYGFTAVAITIAILTQSCTDVITVDPGDAPQQLVVDAWITNESKPQTIRLTYSQPYFDSDLAQGATGAQVGVADTLGNVFVFEDQGNGDYVWTPEDGETLGAVGTRFALGIEIGGETYTGISTMHRVPPIDSIVVELREEELGSPAGHYAQFYARDPVGTGDAYWIKTYKNGVFLNKPFEMNIAYDAGFDAGSQVDGIIFITPIRESINRVPDPDDIGSDDDFNTPPWAPGDEIRVEIHSITLFAFEFLTIARDQMTNGANTIFAIPLANTRGNVVNTETGELALGMFNVSAVSSMRKVVE